ncbi:MAG: hypothetical protein H6719_25235 [Sandaracinaceae bacterium]|nr:hypothetical protein [Sandaracinaceae bacterium]
MKGAVAVALLALLVVASPARAQDADSARSLFERGYAALLDGRFPEARDRLQESLDRQARPATAFNLVLALLGTEQPVRARAVCERLLDDGFGRLRGAHRAEAERECARADVEVGHLDLAIEGATRADIQVDGAPSGVVENGRRQLELDPGPHLVAVRTNDGRTAQQRVRIERGHTRRLVLTVSAAAATGGPVGDVEPVDDEPPWALIGVLTGSALALIVGAILIGWAVDAANGPEPLTDPVFGVVMALR